jgi:hypothetical protein
MNMKTLVIFSMFFSCATSATELEIKDVQMACIEKSEAADKADTSYRYGIELLIQNSSEQSVILATKINSSVMLYEDNKYQITLNYDVSTRGDSVLIPPRDKLGLVELFPGDETLISYQFSDKNVIELASFQLYSKAIYGGRFKNWVGRLNTGEVKPQILYSCKT